jgi:hypothetical protein
MDTFAIKLPHNLFNAMAEKTEALSCLEQKLMERALEFYLDHLEKEENNALFKNTTPNYNVLQLLKKPGRIS